MTDLKKQAYEAFRISQENLEKEKQERVDREYEEAFAFLSERLPIQKIPGNKRKFLFDEQEFFFTKDKGVYVKKDPEEWKLIDKHCFEGIPYYAFNTLVGYGLFLTYVDSSKRNDLKYEQRVAELVEPSKYGWAAKFKSLFK